MREEEAFVLVVCSLATVVVLRGLFSMIGKSRMRRLEVVERALQSGALDPATKQMLIAELMRPGPVRRALTALGHVWSNGRVLVIAGWIGIFMGIGIFVSGGRDAREVGFPVALVSFAVLSIPFVLRELDRTHGRGQRA